MKKLLSIVFIMVSVHVFAQTNPITGINITLPANPDANTANWGTGTSVFMISARGQANNGRIDPAVEESKILVMIKQNGSKVYGAYTSTTAPASDFGTITKVWSGGNAASFLGKDYILPPGDYELSVQFFGYSLAKTVALSDEKIKPFTIKGNDQQSYQVPQLILPADGTAFNEADIKKPITFRWTPVIPKPQGPVTYRLSVWQLMQGQSGPQAIKTNQPVITKDIDALTQTVITNLVTGPCKPPYLCDFVYTVQALSRDGKGYGANNGTSDIGHLSVYYGNVYGDALFAKPALPANGTIIKANERPKFTWQGGNPPYTIRIVEVIGGQSPVEAFRTNKPFFEKDSLNELTFNYPASAPKFSKGKTYAWSIPIFDRWGYLKTQNNPNPVDSKGKPLTVDTKTAVYTDGPVATFTYDPVDPKGGPLTVDTKTAVSPTDGPVTAVNSKYPHVDKIAVPAPNPAPQTFVIPIHIDPSHQVVNTLTVTAISPNEDCATTDVRPNFQWEVKSALKYTPNVKNELTLVEMAVTDTTLAAFDTKPPILVIGNITTNSYKIPASSPALVMGKIYAWRVKTFQGGQLAATSDINFFYINSYKLPYDITTVTCCTTSLVTNGGFQDGNAPGVLGGRGTVTGWSKGNGGPVVSSNADGDKDPGYVEIQGNIMSGSSIKQALTNKIIRGNHYRVSLSVRLKKSLQNSNYVLVKVIAFNGTLPSSELHPTPSSDLAIIGWTGKLTLDQWGATSLNIWTANKNFDNIAVYCYTNSKDSLAVCDIDNICLAETKQTQSCGDYDFDAGGQPIIDTSITNNAVDTTYNNYDEYMGLTSDLYSLQGNTALDTFYPPNDPCSSIGGFVPPGVQNINLADSLHAVGFPGSPGDLDKLLSQTYPDSSTEVDLPKILPIASKCKQPVVLNNSLPFGGRDLIFVHGLQLGHLCARYNGVPGAQANWPAGAAEFYGNGYYKQVAEDCWADHIRTWLTSKGYKNRYLIIAYNCSQPMKVAVHAMLQQIRDAMNDGTGVVYDRSDQRGNSCFGNNSVIISHSTGGLLTDIAMATANMSKTDPAIQAQFGNVGFISDNVKLHVAFHPVLEGSKMATIFLASQTSPALGTLLNSSVCSELAFPTPRMIHITFSSILVDLQPLVVKAHWSEFVDKTPVPTITIAGGHPLGVNGMGPLNWAIHPGLDDGVSTMSSQSGNPNFETGATPSGYFYGGNDPYRVFDMGIGFLRAVSYYKNQTLFTLPHYVGGASVTNLSPTGMVQPVGSVLSLSSPENRYHNHYSFIQSASDHFTGPRGKALSEGFDPNNYPGSSGYQSPDFNYAKSYGERNYEESRAITNMDIYNKGLVSTAMETMQFEHKRGEFICIPIPIPNFALKRHPLRLKFWWSFYYINIPVWERRYDNLLGYDTQDECSYVYTYVLRQ